MSTTDEEVAAPHAAALAAAAAAAAAAQHVMTENKAGDVMVVDAVAAAAQEAVTATDNAAATAATAVATDDAAAAVAATLAIGIEVGAVTSDETVLKTTGRLSVLNDEDDHGKRKFFPRVKQLITNAHWEDVRLLFLSVFDRVLFCCPFCVLFRKDRDRQCTIGISLTVFLVLLLASFSSF